MQRRDRIKLVSAGLGARKEGFTLIELLAVVVIVAILMAAAAPSFFNITEATRLDRAQDLVVRTVRYARSYAIANNRGVYVVFPGNEDHTNVYATAQARQRFLKAMNILDPWEDDYVLPWRMLPDGIIFEPGRGIMDTNSSVTVTYPDAPGGVATMPALLINRDGSLHSFGTNVNHYVFIKEGLTNAETESDPLLLSTLPRPNANTVGLGMRRTDGAIYPLEEY
jgi:prepilin-type N-terminal cleavage/methylation domain-containing protein